MGDSFASTLAAPAYYRLIERQGNQAFLAVVESLMRLTFKRLQPGAITIDAIRRGAAAVDTRLGRTDADVTITRQMCDHVAVEWLDVPQSRPDRIFLYLHGGAFSVRLPKMQTAMVARWCRALGARALMPRYRLAPEHPFPAGPDDCLAAYRWLLDHCGDATQIVIAGDSAGGNLSLVTLLRARDAGLPMPAATVALSPAVDFSMSGRSAVVNEAVDPLFTVAMLRWMGEMYLPEMEMYMSPHVSPLVGDFTGLPPLLFQVGGNEMLLDDSTRAAAKAHASGVKVQLDVFAGMPHVFQAIPQLAECEIADASVFAFLANNAGWHSTHHA
ncbi:MAG: alpha/beta hydrolase [Rhodocyclaceae bacterium]|nr:alpha/beta hydrolase [Rhodocyclaceae bacterium]MBL0074569.1 alpha/beta hydrolase [Rhodocyclaceae bacterium]